MKQLSVAITGAKLVAVTIYPSEPLPRLAANLELLAANGKSVGSISLDSAYGNDKLTISPGLALATRGLLDEIEAAVTKHCQNLSLELPPPAEVVE